MNRKFLKTQVVFLSFLALFSMTLSAADPAALMDKVAEASGGASFKELESMVVHGNISMAQQMNGQIEMTMKESGKSKVKMTMTGNGMQMVAEQGCDGENCYDSNPMMGARLLQGQEKEQFKISNNFKAAYEWRDYYKDLEYQGEAMVGDRKTHKVKMKTSAGIDMTQYIDMESNLVLRMDMVTIGPMGQMNIESYFEDYKDIFKGIQYPMKSKMTMMGQEVLITFDKVEVNQPVPDSMFELPPSLKAQVQ